jgi:hypothetical protein
LDGCRCAVALVASPSLSGQRQLTIPQRRNNDLVALEYSSARLPQLSNANALALRTCSRSSGRLSIDPLALAGMDASPSSLLSIRLDQIRTEMRHLAQPSLFVNGHEGYAPARYRHIHEMQTEIRSALDAANSSARGRLQTALYQSYSRRLDQPRQVARRHTRRQRGRNAPSIRPSILTGSPNMTLGWPGNHW